MPGMNLTRAEARERADLISVESYDVSLDLTRGDKVFGSTTAVKFSARPGSSTFIDAVTHKVHSVMLNGIELDPAEVSDGIRIQLPDLAAENNLLVVAEAPYMNTGEGLHRFVDPVDNEVYLYTQFEVPDSRRMFAVFEQPDLKASFTFTVTAPSHWDVVSNSPTPVPIETIPGEGGGARSVWEFAPTPRLSSYVTALVAGPYQSVRSEVKCADGRVVPLGVFARKSLMQYLDADNIFELTRQGFEFFEAQFGCPYPFEKYDQLFVPEFNAGAMENAGAVTILEGYVFRGKVTGAQIERRAITVLHELAHMWFGDLVTMRWWNDLWLNESFAEYMSHLAAVENTEFDHAWTTFASVEKSWAYRQDQLPTTHPIFAEINDLQDVEVNFDGITYAKGASVLRQLVAWVGPEQFMSGVREYFSKHAWKNTELSDLMVELEKASGRDLDQWGRLWLETAGVNTLTPDVAVDSTGAITSFAIVQSAVAEQPTIRPHRLAVGFYNVTDGQLVRVHREELDVDGERTEVPALAGLQQPDLVLLNDDDLAYAKVRLDAKSLATATAHLKDFRESLPRTLVWGSAWDAARDGESPARGYVELILANIASESDSSVILVQLRQLATTLTYYVAEEHREKTSVAAADTLWDLAGAVPAGSDAQLQFVKSYALLARSDSQLDTVSALLDGLRRAGRAHRRPGPAVGAARLAGGRRTARPGPDRCRTRAGQHGQRPERGSPGHGGHSHGRGKGCSLGVHRGQGRILQRPAGLRGGGFHARAGSGAAGAVHGEVLRRRSRHRCQPHPRTRPADRRRALPVAADHPGNCGPDGRVPGRPARRQRRPAAHDAGKPRRRGPRAAGPPGRRRVATGVCRTNRNPGAARCSSGVPAFAVTRLAA